MAAVFSVQGRISDPGIIVFAMINVDRSKIGNVVANPFRDSNETICAHDLRRQQRQRRQKAESVVTEFPVHRPRFGVRGEVHAMELEGKAFNLQAAQDEKGAAAPLGAAAVKVAGAYTLIMCYSLTTSGLVSLI